MKLKSLFPLILPDERKQLCTLNRADGNVIYFRNLIKGIMIKKSMMREEKYFTDDYDTNNTEFINIYLN